MNIFEMISSFPLIDINENYVDYLTKNIFKNKSIKYEKLQKWNRQINNDNLFNVNRLGLIDTLVRTKFNIRIGL